jgi:hypothetical protein
MTDQTLTKITYGLHFDDESEQWPNTAGRLPAGSIAVLNAEPTPAELRRLSTEARAAGAKLVERREYATAVEPAPAPCYEDGEHLTLTGTVVGSETTAEGITFVRLQLDEEL